ncbi:MAG: 6-bladed beta-propeller [Gemmatimonadota bacterium]
MPAFLLGALLASACGDPPADRLAAYVNVRDSAGIQIVENGPLASVDTLGIMVDSAARLRIGLVDGDAPYVFSRIVGATRLADGRVAVADQRAAEVRFFDGEGRFLAAVGGAGQGPGEYTLFSAMHPLQADSLLIVDHEGNRWHFSDGTGTPVRTLRAVRHSPGEDPSRSPYHVRGSYTDGTLLVSRSVPGCTGEPSLFCADSVRLRRVTRRGEVRADFGVVPRWRRYFDRSAVNGRNTITLAAVFYPQVSWAVAGMRTYIGDGERFEIRVHGPEGRLERLIRVDAPPERYPAEGPTMPLAADATAEQRQQHARMLGVTERAPKPDHLPVFTSLVTDELGNLWVHLVGGPNSGLGTGMRWAVFDSEGELRHLVRTPVLSTRSPMTGRGAPEIGADYLLTEATDSFNVPVVDVYPLGRRNGG